MYVFLLKKISLKLACGAFAVNCFFLIETQLIACKMLARTVSCMEDIYKIGALTVAELLRSARMLFDVIIWEGFKLIFHPLFFSCLFSSFVLFASFSLSLFFFAVVAAAAQLVPTL